MRIIFFVRIAILSLALSSCGFAQFFGEFWIKASDDQGSTPCILWYGNHSSATYGIGGEKDSLNPSVIERESPPPNPGLFVVWKPSRPGVNWGNGFLTYDFKGLHNVDWKDTFKIYFIHGEESLADIRFEWADAYHLGDYCYAMTIRFGSEVIDMFAQNNYTVVDAGDLQLNNAIIIKTGWYPLGVEDDNPPLPGSYGLSQNIPNPFNPSTVINYQLPEEAHVSIIVYNILGEEVALLVDRFEPAGYKSVEFSAAGISSGVYFYRILTDAFIDVKKLVVMK